MDTTDLPVAIIGAGPVGLAAAAQLLGRGITPLVLEAGDSAGASVREWAHVRFFSPWRYAVDAAARALLVADPANWISQPMINLSVAPTLTDAGLRARHLDLRPFAVTGRDTWVLPGGLSRVALKEGSLIVNSSQGGGSKDTWVLAE